MRISDWSSDVLFRSDRQIERADSGNAAPPARSLRTPAEGQMRHPPRAARDRGGCPRRPLPDPRARRPAPRRLLYQPARYQLGRTSARQTGGHVLWISVVDGILQKHIEMTDRRT